MTIGERIAEARDRAGLTQQQMADLCEVSLSTWWRYEAGRSEMPAPVFLRACAKLGLDPAKLEATP